MSGDDFDRGRWRPLSTPEGEVERHFDGSTCGTFPVAATEFADGGADVCKAHGRGLVRRLEEKEWARLAAQKRLTEFLLARIAEEEVWARLAPAGIVARLRDKAERVAQAYGDPEPPEDEGVSLADAMWWTAQDAADWITRHDPARVLTECDAKRRIVENEGRYPEAESITLRFLALPYADHPDYDERWRP